ncbi:MAG: hypothetical protein V4491_06020, partial [Pseudomonadota bacterium]
MTTRVTDAYRLARKTGVSRPILLMTCATLALASNVAVPRDAYAQAFNGTMSSPDASQTSLGSGTETITVTAPTATIDWTASSNDFLPLNNTATFTSSSGITDYTVLNRVTPADASNPIQLNGNVISTLQGSSTIGGNIWFYSPSGIIVGAKATFDVGGLLLTSLTTTLTTNGPNGFSASFSKETGDGGPIRILGGSTGYINALQAGSYVALVGPSIEQAGDVRVNGSVAYVAGEAVTMVMDNGLFDIKINVGTDDPNGIIHTGSTTGPANVTNGKMYLLAVPKNTAIQMLIGGTLGYDATTAGLVNGAVILGSGITEYDDIADPYAGITINNTDSNILIDDAHFLSDVQAYAMNQGSVPASAGDVTFDGNFYMSSFYGDLSMIADGKTITVLGYTNLYTSPPDFPPYLGPTVDSETRTAGDITVQARNGGTITTSNMNLNASAKGQDNTGNGNGNGGDGYGGNISISATSGGTLTTGSLTADASGSGGNVQGSSGTAGSGYGGIVNLSQSSGTVTVNGSLDLIANGIGGSRRFDSTSSDSLIGGNGYGGYSTISSTGPGS